MIKEKNLAVKEVDVVLEVLMEYYNKKESMPYDVLESVINILGVTNIFEVYTESHNCLHILQDALKMKF